MLVKLEDPFTNTDRKSLNVLRAKCLAVGNPAVGKSSIVQAFVNENHTFQKNYNMTCGVNICMKKVSIPDTDDIVELHIYDSSGKDMYLDVESQLWSQPSMVFSVFDVTNADSLASCGRWLDMTRKSGASSATPGVLVGTKSDLQKRRTVTKDSAIAFARERNLRYFECSAKENIGVEEPFFYLVNEWHKMYLEKMEFFKSLS